MVIKREPQFKKIVEKEETKRNFKIIVIAFITVLFWAWGFIGIKIALKELSPENLTLLRFLIASLVFVPYLVFRRARIEQQDILRILLLGLSVLFFHLSLHSGEVYVASGTASLIISTIPVFVFIASISLLKERISKPKVVGTFSALAGVFVIILGTGTFSYKTGNYIGAFLVLLAVFSATFYTIYGKIMFLRYPPSILTAYSFILGTIPFLLFLTPQNLTEIFSISRTTWYSVLFLGFCSSAVGYMGWYYILEKLEASKAAVFLQIIPVVAVISGVIFLNEVITPVFGFGAVMVVIGVYLVNRKKS
jgi:drug/metabolite transporter (DMT)-like permease